MYPFHTAITTIAFVLLLLAVLRYRQHQRPLPLVIGAVVACVGQIFPLASVIVGIERVSAVLQGRFFPNDGPTSIRIDSHDISEDYMLVLQLSHAVGQVGMLLIAIGFLVLVNRMIRKHHEILPQP